MPDSKDLNSPNLIKEIGAYHPINQTKDSIMNLLLSFGFEIINGPEIETEEFNFDMLNIKKTHPFYQHFIDMTSLSMCNKIIAPEDRYYEWEKIIINFDFSIRK